jgi:hypothetical protein
MNYVGNSFSLQMLPGTVRVTCERLDTAPDLDEIPGGFRSVVGHADIAAIICVPYNRESVRLLVGDSVYVVQVVGGRLPEGTTVLPPSVRLEWWRVTVLG